MRTETKKTTPGKRSERIANRLRGDPTRTKRNEEEEAEGEEKKREEKERRRREEEEEG